MWYNPDGGHYHTETKIDRLEILFENFDVFDTHSFHWRYRRHIVYHAGDCFACFNFSDRIGIEKEFYKRGDTEIEVLKKRNKKKDWRKER